MFPLASAPDDRRSIVSTHGVRSLASVLCSKSRVALRQEADGDAHERDNIRSRPVPGIEPRRYDDNLRNDDCSRAHHPPPLRPGEEEDRGHEEQCRTQKPKDAE